MKHVRYASRASKIAAKRALPPPPDGQLPPREEWKDRFFCSGISKKPTLHNLVTARKLVKGFGLADATKPKIVVEAFAGMLYHV